MGEEIAQIAAGLTKAQHRAVFHGQNGYYDDDGLRGSERAMFYRLIDQGLFARPLGVMMDGRRPDLALTPLGLAVRAHLLAQGGSAV